MLEPVPSPVLRTPDRFLPLLLACALVFPAGAAAGGIRDDPNQLEGIRVERDADFARVAWREAKLHRKRGQHDKAVASLREAYRHGYAEAEVHYYLGRSLLEAEHAASALHHLEQARQDNQDDQTIYVAIGKAHSLQGDVEQEIAFYQQALQIDPDYGEAHFLLALAFDKVDNSPKVLEHAQKAIRIDPDYKEKLKPRIKDSNVSRKIGVIVSRVLEDSKFERLTDEKIEEYAEEIGRILGSTRKPGDGLTDPDHKKRLAAIREQLRQRYRPSELPASPFAPAPVTRNPKKSVEEPPKEPGAAPPEPEEPPMRGFLR